MSHRYGTLSKGYTGAKCWQMCEMNPCMHNNKISCPGRPYGLSEEATHLLLLGICGSFMWIICTWILSLANWRTERKIEWEVTFSLRRTAEGRGFGRVSFTFSPSFLGTSFAGSFCFVCGFGFCFLLVFSGNQVFAITACPLNM